MAGWSLRHGREGTTFRIKIEDLSSISLVLTGTKGTVALNGFLKKISQRFRTDGENKSSKVRTMSKIVVAFDLYGTLLSTQSIAEELATHFGSERATAIATAWRKYQLEYTWRLNSMSMYIETNPASPSRP